MTRWAFVFALAFLALIAAQTAQNGAVPESALRLWATAIQTQHLSGGEGLSWREVGETLPQLLARVVVNLPGSSVVWLLGPAIVFAALLCAWILAVARHSEAEGRWASLFPLLFLLSPEILRVGVDPDLSILSMAALLLAIFFLSRLETGDERAEVGLSFALAVFVLAEPNAFYFLIGLALLLPSALRRQGGYAIRAFRALRILALAGGTFALVAAAHAVLGRTRFGSVFELWMEPAHGIVRLDRFQGGDLPTPDLTPLPHSLALLVLCTPLVFVLGAVITRFRSLRHPVTGVTVILVPLFALFESHALGHNATPAFWLAMTGAVMLIWLAIEPLPPLLRKGLLGLALAQSVLAWALPGAWAEREAGRWRTSLLLPVDTVYADARMTSRFLSRFQSVVLDERVAFPLVAMSTRPTALVSIAGAIEGEADGPGGFDPEVIVVMNPSLEGGMEDRLHFLTPGIWTHGRPGYTMVLDLPCWRVYRRDRGLTIGI